MLLNIAPPFVNFNEQKGRNFFCNLDSGCLGKKIGPRILGKRLESTVRF